MYKTNISILKEDDIAYHHLLARLADALPISTTEHIARRVITLESSSPKLLKSIVTAHIVDIIVHYYKLQYIKSELRHVITPEVACLLGAVVAFRQAEEREIIREKIEKLSEINLDGLLNFKLADLCTEWTELGKLCSRLLVQCTDKSEVYQLIAFMIGLEESTHPEVIIDEMSHITADDNTYETYPFFDQDILSTLYSIMLLRPSSIVIKNPCMLDTRMVDCIKNLGK